MHPYVHTPTHKYIHRVDRLKHIKTTLLGYSTLHLDNYMMLYIYMYAYLLILGTQYHEGKLVHLF